MSVTEPMDETDHEILDDEGYQDLPTHSNYLNLYQGAALLTADCLGTGILALPANMIVLGRIFGLAFLILQLPINLYAGTILSHSADVVELKQGDGHCAEYRSTEIATEEETDEGTDKGGLPVPGVAAQQPPNVTGSTKIMQGTKTALDYKSIVAMDDERFEDELAPTNHCEPDASTSDFIGMTHVLFRNPNATTVVMTLYYCNIFLVLGDYMLVMSHAVAALLGDQICIPTAGIVASTLMFAVSQLRTMAKLGRTASIVSLMALFLVVIQCLVALARREEDAAPIAPIATGEGLFPKFSALASIGFAVGSQKLFLNIRHEMNFKKEAPKALAISLSGYVSLYVAICLLAGPSRYLYDCNAIYARFIPAVDSNDSSRVFQRSSILSL